MVLLIIECLFIELKKLVLGMLSVKKCFLSFPMVIPVKI